MQIKTVRINKKVRMNFERSRVSGKYSLKLIRFSEENINHTLL